MTRSNLVIAIALVFVGFAACKKNDSPEETPATTTTTTTGTHPAVEATYNTIVINDTILDVSAYGLAQSGNDYSFYAVYVDSLGNPIDLRMLFNPQPITASAFSVVTNNQPNATQTQLTLTYNRTSSYIAVSGGTVNVTLHYDSATSQIDTTILKFNNITFKKQGYPDRKVSGYIACPM